MLATGIQAAVVGPGMFIRSQRELMLALRERTRQAEAERDLRVAQAYGHRYGGYPLPMATVSDSPEAADAAATCPGHASSTSPRIGNNHRRKRRSLTSSIIRTARPKQWVKNVLVFVAPAAAGVLDQRVPFTETLVAFVAFCFAVSGAYFLNDAGDAAADRLHPTKRDRPIVAGDLPAPGLARGIGCGFIVVSLLVAAPINDGKLTGVIAADPAVTIAVFRLWLKHEAVIDLAAVAAVVSGPSWVVSPPMS